MDGNVKLAFVHALADAYDFLLIADEEYGGQGLQDAQVRLAPGC